MTKKMMLIAIVFYFSVCDALGAGFIKNPDRYPSVGVSLGVTNIDGSFANAASFNADSEIKTRDFTIDLRLPVSHELTLFGGVSVLKEEALLSNQNISFSERDDLSGFGFRIGARYYFNR